MLVNNHKIHCPHDTIGEAALKAIDFLELCLVKELLAFIALKSTDLSAIFLSRWLPVEVSSVMPVNLLSILVYMSVSLDSINLLRQSRTIFNLIFVCLGGVRMDAEFLPFLFSIHTFLDHGCGITSTMYELFNSAYLLLLLFDLLFEI